MASIRRQKSGRRRVPVRREAQRGPRRRCRPGHYAPRYGWPRPRSHADQRWSL